MLPHCCAGPPLRWQNGVSSPHVDLGQDFATFSTFVSIPMGYQFMDSSVLIPKAALYLANFLHLEWLVMAGFHLQGYKVKRHLLVMGWLNIRTLEMTLSVHKLTVEVSSLSLYV